MTGVRRPKRNTLSMVSPTSPKEEVVNGDGQSSLAVVRQIDDETRFGWGPYKPDCLQKVNNRYMALVLVSFFSFLQGFTINGLLPLVTVTLTVRFSLSMADVGVINSAYDITAAISGVFLSYIGDRSRKNRVLALAAICASAGCLLFMLPHFTAPSYEFESRVSTMCRVNQSDALSMCEIAANLNDGSISIQSNKHILFAGIAIIGIGGGVIYTVGIAWLDDGVSVATSAFFQGIVYLFSSVGVACGYGVGSALLKIWVNFDREATPIGADPLNPSYVGAWWLGFLACGVIFFLLAVIFSCFGNELPEAAAIRGTRKDEQHMTRLPAKLKNKSTGNDLNSDGTVHHHSADDHTNMHGSESEPDLHHANYNTINKDDKDEQESLSTCAKFIKDIKHFLQWTMELLFNGTFVLLTIGTTLFSFQMQGFVTFFSSMVGNQLQLSQQMAGLLPGAIIILCVPTAAVFGGSLIRRYDMQVRSALLLLWASLAGAMLVSPFILLHCDTPQLASSSLPTNGSDLVSSIESSCNQQCECDKSLRYQPVCFEELNIQFFSPCHAGCTTRDGKGLTDCKCVEYELKKSTNYTDQKMFEVYNSTTLQVGNCPGNCPMSIKVGFIFLSFCFISLSYIQLVPVSHITMRIVPEEQRSYALGLMGLFTRALAAIPGPIVLGAIIDSTCDLWQETCTGDRGKCWIFDNFAQAWKVTLFAVGFRGTALVIISCIFLVYKPPNGEPLKDYFVKLLACDWKNKKKTEGENDAGQQPAIAMATHDEGGVPNMAFTTGN